jgi:hypothetical protein
MLVAIYMPTAPIIIKSLKGGQLIVSLNYAVIFEAGAIHPSTGESPACSCRTKWCNDRQVVPVHCNPSLESVVLEAFYLNADTTAFIAIQPQMSRIARKNPETWCSNRDYIEKRNK